MSGCLQVFHSLTMKFQSVTIILFISHIMSTTGQSRLLVFERLFPLCKFTLDCYSLCGFHHIIILQAPSRDLFFLFFLRKSSIEHSFYVPSALPDLLKSTCFISSWTVMSLLAFKPSYNGVIFRTNGVMPVIDSSGTVGTLPGVFSLVLI